MKKNTVEYLTPEIECIEMNAEGVLCASGDSEVINGGNAFTYEEYSILVDEDDAF